MIVFRSRTVFHFVTVLFAALMLVACGGNGTFSPTVSGPATPGPITISISPSPASTVFGGTVQFTATVTGTTNTGVNWSVLTESGGTISSTGLYSAPTVGAAKPSQAKTRGALGEQITIQAQSQADPTKTATAIVTVSVVQPIAISISPSPASTFFMGTVQFTATVTGTTNTAVSWSVLTPGGGTISSTGLYQAPANNSADPAKAKTREAVGPQVTIQAQSQADTTKTATAVVTVTDLVVAITPQNPTVVEGKTLQLAATVTGPGVADHSVHWNGSSLSATGLFTAPLIPGVYSVEAFSNAENGPFATDAITVVPPAGITISVNPPTANANTGGQNVQFSATVGGTPNTDVTWSVVLIGSSVFGSITPGGLYTPPTFVPQSPMVVQVKATSVADPSKSATANITVTDIS